MKEYKIYQYTNKINGKVYIGQTRQPIQNRSKKDGRGYKRCPKFWAAIQKYGWDNFELKVLETCSAEEVDEREKFYISQHDPKNMYNVDPGGKHKSRRVNTLSTREKLSRALKGVNAGEKNGMYGKISPSSKKVYEYHLEDSWELVKIYESIDRVEGPSIGAASLSARIRTYGYHREGDVQWTFGGPHLDPIKFEYFYGHRVPTYIYDGEWVMYQSIKDAYHKTKVCGESTMADIVNNRTSKRFGDRVVSYEPIENPLDLWDELGPNHFIHDFEGNFITSFRFIKDVARYFDTHPCTTFVRSKESPELYGDFWICPKEYHSILDILKDYKGTYFTVDGNFFRSFESVKKFTGCNMETFKKWQVDGYYKYKEYEIQKFN